MPDQSGSSRRGKVADTARFLIRHRRIVLGVWVLVLVALLAAGQFLGGATSTQFSLPGSESQRAFDRLEGSGFGNRAGLQAEVVFRADGGVKQPSVRQPIESMLSDIKDRVADVTIVSPYSQGGANQVSPDGSIAYAEIDFTDRSQEAYKSAAQTIRDIRNQYVSQADFQIELGGDVFSTVQAPTSEAYGIGAAAIILLFVFGSLLAMSLPIISALFGIGAASAIISLAANFIAVPDFATPAAAMIGIGVGIDYALFIVTRYRDSLRGGQDERAAAITAMDTSGRAIMFAGITVVISLLGMFLLNLTTIRALAVAATAAVLMTMLASLSLLPAMLGFVGRNIDRFGLPHRKSAEQSGEDSFWQRWSRMIQRYPLVFLVGGVSLLLIVAIPLLSMRLGFADAGNRPTSDTTRRAYDLLAQGFGPGSNGPLLLVAELPGDGSSQQVLGRLASELQHVDGVAFVSPPQTNPAGDTAIMQVVPKTSPQAVETEDLVHHLRDDVIPSAVAQTNVTVYVGGGPAIAIDFSEYAANRLPYFMGAVLLLSFLLLMMVFRSVVVPLKAVPVNLLSIGAAFGVMVAVFQWGWAGQLVGIGRGGPIEAWAPLIIFPIVFGLSMDYEVFLLSRVKEEYDRRGDNGVAVADGLASTARVISAAALIMIVVFLSFVLGDSRPLKLMGFGLAVAVFLDATVVRLIIVPSAMELLGDFNWWMPKWLARLLPHIQIEAQPEASKSEQPRRRRQQRAASPRSRLG